MASVMGEKAVSAIRTVFDFMSIADEVLVDLQEEQPSYATAIRDCFRYLSPGVLLNGHKYLYRNHCRELVHRRLCALAVDPIDIPLNWATDAEVCFHLSQCSLISPLQYEAGRIYLYLFDRIFPDMLPAWQKRGMKLPRVATLELHEHDMLEDFRKQFAVAQRDSAPTKTKKRTK